MVITKRYNNGVPWHSYGIWSSSRGGNKWSSRIQVANSSCGVHQKEAPKMNEWTQFISTYDGKEIKLYVNGKLNGISKCGSKLEYSNMPLRVGVDNPSGNKFHGAIDDIRIYNRALNDCEIDILIDENDKENFKEIALNYISINTNKWNKKDEYETTNDYEKRVKNGFLKKEKEFKNYILDSISSKILGSLTNPVIMLRQLEFLISYVENLEAQKKYV